MRGWSLLDVLSLMFSALLGVAVIWGVLTLFAFSLVFILPVLVLVALVWGAYVWWKLQHVAVRTTVIEGESRVIEIVEVKAEDNKPAQED